MRELKFRVWDKHAKCFCGNLKKYLLNIHTGELEVANYSDLYEEWYYSYHMENDYIIQQYTGLKDKHGKDIYEGDILFFQQQDGVWPNQLNKNIEVKYPFVCGNTHLGEIIGNIFENPELLK